MSKKENIFFMEIFNEILKINDYTIVIIYDIDSNIWFGLKDIILALGYLNYKKANTKLKVTSSYVKKYIEIRGVPLEGHP